MMTETPDTPEAGGAPATLADEIATLAALISQARELVATGHSIDLAALSERIGAFCADVAAEPPADAESVTQMIEALVSDLNALGREMAEQHAALTGGDGGDGGSSSGDDGT